MEVWTLNNIFFKNMILVVWKYAQMHQNTFLTTPDGKKCIFWKKVFGGLKVCADASKHVLTTPDVKKYLFK